MGAQVPEGGWDKSSAEPGYGLSGVHAGSRLGSRQPTAGLQRRCLHRAQTTLSNATDPSPDYAVIWLPGLDYQAALHSKRKTDRILALTRLGQKYGVRVRFADEEATFKLLRPEHAFSRVKAATKYKLHPLPHGLTRQGLQCLAVARAAWEVGTEQPPPAAALATSCGFALPIQVSASQPSQSDDGIVASSKTRRHMQTGPDRRIRLPKTPGVWDRTLGLSTEQLLQTSRSPRQRPFPRSAR